VLGRLAGDMYAPMFTSGTALEVAASYNLLMLGNFLPLLPMDGGRTFAALAWAATGDRARGTRIAAATGPFLVGGAVLAVAGYIAFALDDPAWGIAIACGLVFQLRGAFDQRFDAPDLIADLRVADIMCPALRARPESLARSVIDDRIGRKHSPDLSRHATLDLPYVVITDEGEAVGMLTPGEVEQLALEHHPWGEVTIADVMTPISGVVRVTPETSAHTALVYMFERRLEAVLVVEDGSPVGCVTAQRLMAAMEGEAPQGAWRPPSPESAGRSTAA
ncbi:MAG: CBS domain-containing protein, partial [Gemmatimonadales bacterium]